MTPGQMVKSVAVALDVPEETVTQHDRNLVMGGLRTKGGRGRSSPHVTHRDAARLVAAVLGSRKVKDSVEVVTHLEKTRVYPGDALPFPKFADLPAEHSFIDGLTAIIEEVDTPAMFEDFATFASRFSKLWVMVSDSRASIAHMTAAGKMTDALYTVKSAPRSKPQESREFPWDWANYLGIEQELKIRGNCLMILGLCFQKGPVSSVLAAGRAWSAPAKKIA